MIETAVLTLLFVATVVSVLYLAVVLACILRFAERRPPGTEWRPPVTVLKPLCGSEPLLEENLRSFCTQDYPEYEVIFGVHSADDLALGIVDRLAAEGHPCRIDVVVDGRMAGPNAKVSNLANMQQHAKYDVVVVSDSDMRVDSGWLAQVVSPLGEPRVGLVTCLYRARPVGGAVSTLGAMYVNDWFAPAVMVAASFNGGPFGFGSTLALRRETLEAVGGFEELSEYLADDYVLAARVAARGQDIVLASPVVETIVSEPGLRALFARELRWARVVRSVRPLGWALSCVTYALPLATAHWLLSRFSTESTALLAGALALRTAIHAAMPACLGLRSGRAPWLIPARDAMTAVVWAVSFVGSTVEWRGRHMSITRSGRAGRCDVPVALSRPSC
jgi:ceramide glucosyltransferase